MIKKILQKIFKKFSYSLFFKIYGTIEKSIDSGSDNRIKVEIVNAEKDLRYKVYKIVNGRLYTDRVHDTAVILDNKIIEGPSFQFRYTQDGKVYNSKINDNVVFNKGTPRKLKNLNGTVLSLLTGGAGNSNYWHWLTDVLPRFALCSKAINLSKIDYFLLPSLLKKFQNETLDCLNIPKNKRLSSEKFRHVKAKELIVTDHPVVISGSATEGVQNIPKWVIVWLKDNFLNKNITTDKKNSKKIYIDRNDATFNNLLHRSITNEDEVKRYLLKNNFVSVKLHEINFKEQVDLFNKAECVVGLHGAGFTNIIFCKPGTKVIELKNSNAGPMYENVAKKNDLNYTSITVEAKQSHPNQEQIKWQQGRIHVPIENLSKILENK